MPELSSEIWALLTQDIAELRGDQTVEKLLDASIEENVTTLLHVFENGLVNGRGRYLFVPRDESLAWMWIPLVADTGVSEELLTTAFENGDGMVRVAVGAPGYGLDGFRQTHVQEECIDDRRADLELASRACQYLQYLGQAVLRPVDAGAVGRARHSAGVSREHRAQSALITFTTERRTDVR